MLEEKDPLVFKSIKAEEERQKWGIELIASENYVSEEVLEATGSILTNKYAEGYPKHRYYGGCKNIDDIEDLAIKRATDLFGADHANVQPHSGSSANMAVYFAMLEEGDTIMGMDLSCGGHLTHGAKVSFSGTNYNSISYGIDSKTELIDYDEIESKAKKHKPKMIIAGASAYSREIDFKRFKEIAEKVGAYLMVDIAHIAGLVACGLHQSPVLYADFVTSTTHKTLRGPRGGFILCKKEYASKIDKAIFPGLQGGPLEHVIAAKAVAFGEALKPEFRDYAKNIVANMQTLSEELKKEDFDIVSGGTDNHLILLKLDKFDVTGKEAEEELEKVGITVNKNAIPNDPKPLKVTSGIRIGTPAVTSRGFTEEDMKKVAKCISKIVKNIGNDSIYKEVSEEVRNICQKYPIPGVDKKKEVNI